MNRKEFTNNLDIFIKDGFNDEMITEYIFSVLDYNPEDIDAAIDSFKLGYIMGKLSEHEN